MTRSEKEKEIIHLITSLSSYIMKIRYDMSLPYDLSTIQAQILYDLYANPKSKVTDICQRLNKSTNSISPLLQKLESKDFIKREQSNNDARISYLSLKEKGLKVINDLENDIKDYTEPMFKKIDDVTLDSTIKNLIMLKEVVEE